ncbi:DUF4886 domain-containing protein [Pedobacter heparinus]|uniref:DUF4886 domain-containing protein n=1 Tax=Pedobacter heparinus (strain ATCC 13125 / DSM 2366 / CIP 104194 / JCM 7457 / NBRC 12017 / NCIMB 9290 / NRRL B-14731 / HIM 762-3) TaxID=485917 RepID=C6XTF6_PEDHD|nr:DUF4886 domain-containing protein [Pedobacter heparinus]ACU05734.1 hypothetical protein Phep_3543 [Pedobacter heparinus DSM 2366]
MKILIKTKLVIVLVLTMCLQLNAQQAGKTLKVLLIGNSFSQNASRYLPQMAEEAHVKLVLGRAEMGGCSLKRHWDSVLVNDIDTNRGKAYKGQSLRQLLQSQKWDIVTMQQYSLLSGDEGTYQPYATKIYDLVKKYQPDAKVFVHQTWAYRADAVNWGMIASEKRAENNREMWEKSRAAYHLMAKNLGNLPIIPSGDAFYQVATDSKWGFKKDTAFDYANPVYPALPSQQNSINVGYSWGKDKKLQFDPNHANEAGCYLAGLVWYKHLLKGDPTKLKFKPAAVSDEFAAFLKATASKN